MTNIERESMEYDVVVVGAGPAGLSAAIRLKQLDSELNVVVLEKGSEVGAHILSGAVLDPSGLTALIPDWKSKGAPVTVAVKRDQFYLMGSAGKLRLPNFLLPPLMNNHGNYIVSMGNVCRWLAEQAEDLGVEIFPGMACSELVFGDQGEVKGVVAGEFGKNADGTPSDAYEPGMELYGKYVFLSEGVRGSLSKEVIARYDLDRGSDVAKFGLGMKEIWEIDPKKHREGTVTHTMGWPHGLETGRRVVHLPLGQQPSLCRFHCRPELQKPIFQPVSGVSTVQAPSDACGPAKGRQTGGLWGACCHQGWAAIHSENRVSRWRAAGVFCGVGEPAADQGQS